MNRNWLLTATFLAVVPASKTFAAPIVGYLDQISVPQGIATGWAKDNAISDQAIQVHFYADGPYAAGGTLIGVTNASILRPDVGKHAYRFAIPSKYRDGKTHKLFAYGVSQGTSKLLVNSGKAFTVPTNTAPLGTLDAVNASSAIGWALDFDADANSIQVELWIDGAPAGKFAANTSRPDVNLVMGVTGNHGFAVTYPALFQDGKSHSISIKAIDPVSGAKTILAGSPKTIVIPAPQPPLPWPTPIPTNTSKAPQLGVNIDTVCDFCRGILFNDAMKSARSFGKPDSPWDYTNAVRVDANGWPIEDFGILFMSGIPSIAGNYQLSFQGTAQTISAVASGVSVSAIKYDASSDTTTATVTVPPNGTQLDLKFLGTRDGARNIKLFRPGALAGSRFYQPLLDRLKSFQVLRLMDYLATNGSLQIDWADRKHPTDPTQSGMIRAVDSNGNVRINPWTGQALTNPWDNNNPLTGGSGGSYEDAIDLANTVGKDLWVNVPDMATDDYVLQLAKLLKSRLNPELKIYLEYSNEVWNNSFPQTKRNYEAAQYEVAQGGSNLTFGGETDTYNFGWRRIAKRLIQISEIFKSVYGQDAMLTQVRPVLAGMVAIPGIMGHMLDFVSAAYGPPAKYFYGIAGAPYFSPEGVDATSPTATLDQIFDGIGFGINKYALAYSAYLSFARKHGLKNISYEGGLDIQGLDNLNTKLAVNYDPRIGDAIKKYLALWYGCGGDLFMYYNIANGYSEHGSWGLTDDITKSSYKTQAVDQILATPKDQFQCQAQDSANPSSFSTSFISNPGSGTGLKGEYFKGTDLSASNLQMTRLDTEVNADWSFYNQVTPILGYNSDFSARWSGTLEPLFTETYTFTTLLAPSAGVRLWVNGKLVIDDWSGDASSQGDAKSRSGTIALQAGQKVSLRLEMYHVQAWTGNKPSMRFYWSSPSQVKAIVPASQLYLQ